MYKVIHTFADLMDDSHVYVEGDVYPREGKETTLERAIELLGSNNKIGKPLIIEIAEAKPKRTTAKNKEK